MGIGARGGMGAGDREKLEVSMNGFVPPPLSICLFQEEKQIAPDESACLGSASAEAVGPTHAGASPAGFSPMFQPPMLVGTSCACGSLPACSCAV